MSERRRTRAERAVCPPIGALVLASTLLLGACAEEVGELETGTAGGESWRMSGGATTVFDRSSAAFTLPAANLDEVELDLHADGDVAFEAAFVNGPADLNAGLGPVFNNTSCANCHIENGRGMPVVGDTRLKSQLLVRVSVEGEDPGVPGAALGVDGLGTQIQDHAVYGATPEARVVIDFIEHDGEYPDGTPYSLRAPAITVTWPDGTPLDAAVMTSLRQPPPVHGLGLLEAVPEADILALADPDDADGDGISGRPNWVWDFERGALSLGRFSHKANQPSLRQQAAGAFAEDMGVSNPIFADADGTEDIDDLTLSAAAYYTQTLAVPARAPATSGVLRGEELFGELACGSCHVGEMRTDDSHFIVALRNQTIRPYTDLLLHDMGPDLADGRPDFDASGREWRTAPLWGIGLTHTVLPRAGFLHDGRARTIEEAILWHGGEAEQSRDDFMALDAAERAAVLEFLQSL